MSLFQKYLFAITLLLVCMLGLMAFVIIQSVQRQLGGQYEQRLASAVQSVQQELSSRQQKIAAQLNELSGTINIDNEFRFNAVQTQNFTNSDVVEFASKYIKIMGLQLLDIMSADARLVSNGAEYIAFGGRFRERLSFLRNRVDTIKFTRFRGINKQTLCLTQIDSLQMGPQRFYLFGGIEVTSQLLNELRGDTTEIIAVQLPDSQIVASAGMSEKLRAEIAAGDSSLAAISNDGRYSIRVVTFPLLENRTEKQLRLLLFHPRNTYLQLMDTLENNIIFVMVGGFVLAIIISVLMALTVTRPLKRLTEKAGALTLETLDVDFDVRRRDEIGILNNALDRMMQRLRQNRVEISAAEQSGAFADIARQVNHDIKNGFVPIRNVMAHWEEVCRDEPENLPKIFSERKANVLESLEYLENLARRYSRLKPDIKPASIDLNRMIANLLKNYETAKRSNVEFATTFDDRQPLINADAVQLRRAFENVLRNAIEALPDGGQISVKTEVTGSVVTITWVDSGTGIPSEIREILFTEPVTTKPEGTGIGLANVKRIIDSFDGSVFISEIQPHGTAIIIELPLHGIGAE